MQLVSVCVLRMLQEVTCAAVLCAQGFADADTYDCVASYRARLRHVIDHAAAAGLGAGSAVRIFRSTTAAWLKWGNWRVNWAEHDRLQPFTQVGC